MIRRDIWSVKEWDSAVEPAQYVHSRMFRSADSAFRYRNGNPHPEGIPHKVVHPADWVVDFFVLCGNKIDA